METKIELLEKLKDIAVENNDGVEYRIYQTLIQKNLNKEEIKIVQCIEINKLY
jgi:hypothetical protein